MCNAALAKCNEKCCVMIDITSGGFLAAAAAAAGCANAVNSNLVSTVLYLVYMGMQTQLHNEGNPVNPDIILLRTMARH
jgi:hypothetical protein